MVPGFVPTAQIDDIFDELFPRDVLAYSAAWASGAGVSGVGTTFHGIFVDSPGGASSDETWEVAHARGLTPENMRLFERFFPEQDRIEFGAIAVMACVIRLRDGLRLANVTKIGGRSDYSLVDASGAAAGVIEFSGTRDRYTSKCASEKRANVRRSQATSKRIGIVAFGGPELRAEVVA